MKKMAKAKEPLIIQDRKERKAQVLLEGERDYVGGNFIEFSLRPRDSCSKPLVYFVRSGW